MNIEIPENNGSQGKSARQYFLEHKKTRADLLKRADELKKRADRLKWSDPKLSAELMNRSKTLSVEAAAMLKSAEGKSTQKLRRAAALGKLALLTDKE